MAETYRVDVIADIQKYVKPLSELPGVTKANAEKAAIALATSLGKVEGAAAEATAKVQAFNKSLIEQGVSEKAAAAGALKYAQSLANAGAAVTTTGAAADTAAKRTGNLGMAVSGVGQQLSDVASQLATGTNPLTILVQQGPQAATAISMAGYSLSALLPILGPVAVAVGALGAAWYLLSQDVAKAEAAQAKAAETAQKAAESGARLNKMQREALDAEAVATGKASDKDIQLRDALAEVTAEYGPRIDASRKAIAASEAEAAAALKMLQTSSNTSQQLQEAYNTQQAAAAAADFHRRELAGLEQQQGALLQTTTRGILITNEKEKADKGAAKAARDRKDAIRELSDAMQAENDEAERTQRTYQSAIDAINGIERAQKQATASEGERVDMAYAATLDTIAAEERKAMAVSNSVAATETIQQEGERARRAARAAYVQELAKLDEKRNENAAKSLADMEADQKAAADRMRSMWTSINGVIGDTFNTMTGAIISSASTAAQEAGRAIADLQGQIDDITKVELTHAEIAELEGEALVNAYKDGQVAAEDLTNDQRRQLATSLQMEQNAQKLRQEQAEKAAMTAYKVQKGAALASTLINAGLQVSNAAAAIPYPANIPGVVAATIMGAAQVAAAAASPPPKFHAGSLSAAPGPGSARRGNEFTAVLEGGEAIIPRATMQQPGAKEQAAALVSGRSPVAADEVAKGMDRSSIPYYLEQLVRMAKKPAQRTRNTRPGHKPRYGAA